MSDNDPQMLAARGWRYFEIPWMPEVEWNRFKDVMCEGNYQFLSASRRENEDKSVSWSGRVYISPEGVTRLRVEFRSILN